ncbi:hypothetical protein OPV22_028340 [Ensete ventricosum]|uniref:Uncharacterized protein n=1 Tax=Ensete ventricosum TaxID=4639 RepID=A0AAV8PY02_ENSVE|nr:hypothetical protein OPV22_028340 [Ensete ventricosum]
MGSYRFEAELPKGDQRRARQLEEMEAAWPRRSRGGGGGIGSGIRGRKRHWGTLPALVLFYSLSRSLETSAATVASPPIASWKISSPVDQLKEVKASLKFWPKQWLALLDYAADGLAILPGIPSPHVKADVAFQVASEIDALAEVFSSLDKKQTLYRACARITKSCRQSGSIICGKPVLGSLVPSPCHVHFQKAQRNISQALRKAGLRKQMQLAMGLLGGKLAADGLHSYVIGYKRQQHGTVGS